MASQAEEALIVSAADLARSSPENWRRFLAALEVHGSQVKDSLAQAPSDMVFIYQGHAREVAHLLKVFKDCVPMADKIKAKYQGNS